MSAASPSQVMFRGDVAGPHGGRSLSVSHGILTKHERRNGGVRRAKRAEIVGAVALKGE